MKARKKAKNESTPHDTQPPIDERTEQLSEQIEIRICEQTESNIAELIKRAQHGRRFAIECLAMTASKIVHALNEIALHNPSNEGERQRLELLQAVAHKIDHWPAFISRKKMNVRQHKELIEKLQLGRDSIHRGKWNLNSPATQVAIDLYFVVNDHRVELKLPPLTKETWDTWFNAAWTVLLKSTNGHPEQHEALRKIGKHYGEHSERMGAQKKATNATREANIRAGIRRQIRQSFKSYVRVS